MTRSIHIEGIEELSAKLEALTSKEKVSVLRKAGKDAVEPVLSEARARIPQSKLNQYENGRKNYKGVTIYAGHASRSVAAKVWVSRTGSVMAASIGVLKSAFYAVNFVELGTSKQAAQPWLRPALESTHNQVIDIIGAGLRVFIEKIARRRMRQAKRWHRMIAKTGGP
jgi:HK97 gp10 family phage protein